MRIGKRLTMVANRARGSPYTGLYNMPEIEDVSQVEKSEAVTQLMLIREWMSSQCRCEHGAHPGDCEPHDYYGALVESISTNYL